MRTILSLSIVSVLIALPLSGCGDDPPDGDDVSVAASTTQLADLARNVAGDRAVVTGILTASSDPHDYEPEPSDAEAVAGADLVLQSGGDLDLWLDQVVESSGSDVPKLVLIDQVSTIEADDADDEEIDPHWWQDPSNAIVAARAIRDRLIEVDPDGTATYERNAAAYVAELENLDRRINACMRAVPEKQRLLVTSHDALGYYADRYDIEVVGAAIPALTTQAQASAGEVADLVDVIRSSGVTTVFPEAGVSRDLEDAIADEADAGVGAELWADALGPEGSDGATYVDAMASNTAKLVEGFTDSKRTCSSTVGSEP